ncbi:YceI family protein [uncultured Dokdonia sp.]|uniref:YceI family protein n=1 Tax=uncultured Dokdonia sp. TaxID=575653 RepID=UPI00262F2E9B|nr:YceI family protein [uncultured Dokdonia sp.]
MNKLLLLLVSVYSISFAHAQDGYITRQGEVTFFSYTSVENIQATNNQVLSLFYPSSSRIGVQILMRAFTFKKSLMYEHFNESYIESDLYPKATFEGDIIGFDANQEGSQTRIIKGTFTLRDITKPIEMKATIIKTNGAYTISGELEVLIKDYEIKVPPILSPNIAKNIQVSFKFQYVPNDDQK